MDEHELEETMLDFLRGGADCLVATTIIESGLDIPQANTLIVERADQLGLAQAYQIRGRVGRSTERAFAYMLYPSEQALSQEAGQRLATLSDHTELGSGFAIAMRDLELRGAGDLLGDEQSGHVAAIGFELYVSLLDEAVEAMRAAGDEGAEEAEREAPVRLDIDVDAYLPPEYVPFETAKIDIHRRIAGARAAGELRAIRDELRDRFGPVPGAGLEPARAPARPDRDRRGRRPNRRDPRRQALDRPARARRGGGRQDPRAAAAGDVRVAGEDALDARRRRAGGAPRRGSGLAEALGEAVRGDEADLAPVERGSAMLPTS